MNVYLLKVKFPNLKIQQFYQRPENIPNQQSFNTGRIPPLQLY